MQTKKLNKKTFVKEIASLPGGEGIRDCIQCGVCAGSCPNASKMDHTPRELIAMARAGMREAVLSSNAMWLCLSCYLCTVRCPRGIKPTELMHTLEALAVRRNMNTKRSSTPEMYRGFSDFVYSIGSVPEMGFMTWYYLLTNPLRAVKMLPEALSLLKHGRLSPKAKRMKPEAEKQLKAILNKAESMGGVQ